MLNHKPIFINGFQRGGTNILVNLIASSHEVALLGGETHEVFYGRDSQPFLKWIQRGAALPLILASGQHTFWPYRYYPRRTCFR